MIAEWSVSSEDPPVSTFGTQPSGIRIDGYPDSPLQDGPASAIRVSLPRGVSLLCHEFARLATDWPVLRHHLDKRFSLRVLIDAHRVSIWLVSLHRLDGRTRAVPLECSVHGLSLVHLSAVCELL